jgi:glycerate kinase
MRILIAPDKFKSSLGAHEVAENIATGLRDVLPDAKIDIVPMADGGEGTAEVICDALGGSWVNCAAHDSLGRAIEARIIWIEGDKLAIMEMKAKSPGMHRLPKGNARSTSRDHVWRWRNAQLDSAQRGVDQIIIGLGGSATNDGGFGMARALGFRFLLENKNPRAQWRSAKTHEGIGKAKRLVTTEIIAAADVRNPLLGENGVREVFGLRRKAREWR